MAGRPRYRTDLELRTAAPLRNDQLKLALSRIGALFALSSTERRMLAEAFVTMCAVRARLLTSSFARTRRWASRLDSSDSNAARVRVGWSVGAASRFIPGGRNCLVRALTAQRMLNRRGVASELRIGASKVDSTRIEAHAWLESSGSVVIGGTFEPGRYARMLAAAEFCSRSAQL